MRENSITEHFQKIVKDYMVTSFTGQKLDQSFGDQHWEFTDAGGLMQVFEAIADVAEDLIKDYEERLGNLTKVIEINQKLTACESKVEAFRDVVVTGQMEVIPEPPVAPEPTPEPKVKKKRGPNKKKPCVACGGSGNNSKGGICPICNKTETKPEPVVDETNLPPPFVTNKPIEIEVTGEPPFVKAVFIGTDNTPPWLAPKVEPAAPAFFPPPPPPPFWNPNA